MQKAARLSRGLWDFCFEYVPCENDEYGRTLTGIIFIAVGVVCFIPAFSVAMLLDAPSMTSIFAFLCFYSVVGLPFAIIISGVGIWSGYRQCLYLPIWWISLIIIAFIAISIF